MILLQASSSVKIHITSDVQSVIANSEEFLFYMSVIMKRVDAKGLSYVTQM